MSQGTDLSGNSFVRGQTRNRDLIYGLFQTESSSRIRTDTPWAGLRALLPTRKLTGVAVVMVYSPNINEALSKYISRAWSSWITASGTRFAICTIVV